MTDNAPELRASDADRERVTEILRDALAEGRLEMEEFEERLEATYKARTYGELTPITRDLPVPAAAPAVSMRKEPVPDGSWAGRIVGREGSSAGAVAIMSGFQRKGRWTMPKRFNCLAFWGGGEIDLREADFADHEVEINCVAIMGGVQIVVPPGVEVVVRGFGIMGGFDHREDGVPGEPGAPRVIVSGFAFWGGVGIERKRTRAERARLKEERRQEKLDRRAERHELQEARRHELGEARHERRREEREHRREEREHRRYGER
ncbi:DUF1707 domain-containing protein [Streptomyces sp. NPDC001480]|uniref:DUF1707 SHOCT-like domain-containing protein n=1 Tax=Streptomyces sp. NPDC001480 TaxID=3364577 RepID=UPI0036A879D3